MHLNATFFCFLKEKLLHLQRFVKRVELVLYFKMGLT